MHRLQYAVAASAQGEVRRGLRRASSWQVAGGRWQVTGKRVASTQQTTAEPAREKPFVACRLSPVARHLFQRIRS